MKSRKIPGIILALAIALPLLLFSCEKQTEANQPFFCNTEWGCTLGDRFYSAYSPWGAITVYSPEGVRKGLCTDPLCPHDGTDGMCPDDTRAMVRTVATDGEKLYLSLLLDPETAGKKPGSGAVKQIWSLNRDGSNFQMLYSRSSDSRYSSVLEAGGGYLCFHQMQID